LRRLGIGAVGSTTMWYAGGAGISFDSVFVLVVVFRD
jgi:hypothetical protein